MTFPTVSIIFPVHNGGRQPFECVSSIYKLHYPKEKIEVIIIDNASTDKSLTAIKKQFPKVIIISLPKNVGFATAINEGAQKARGTYLFVSNDDVEYEVESLRILITYAQKNETVGVLGGAIYSTTWPAVLVSTGYQMNHWTGIVSPIIKTTRGHPDWIQGCALLTPAKLFKKLAGFNEQFIYLFEDYDYCLRVKKLGYEVISLPTAHFFHHGSKTANKNLAQKYYHWYYSKLLFISKQVTPAQMFTNYILLIGSFIYHGLLRNGRAPALRQAFISFILRSHVA